MTVAATVFAALVLCFAASARWLSRFYITAPIMFVTAGALISAVAPSTTADLSGVKVVAEVTLAFILFHDAAQVRRGQIEADHELIIHLLLVSLPLTVLFGFLAAAFGGRSAAPWCRRQIG